MRIRQTIGEVAFGIVYGAIFGALVVTGAAVVEIGVFMGSESFVGHLAIGCISGAVGGTLAATTDTKADGEHPV